jgi:flavin reductase (DIM6/NTAB) family NADH-FMN oxidoreductase RutF
MGNKVQLKPNTTLFPVPVVLITCGGDERYNVFSLNRIASCNAEPPMLSISVRPQRASHDLIAASGEFAVNIPYPEMELVSDFVGTTTMGDVNKWAETGLTPVCSSKIAAPLLAECPVNLECRVVEQVRLPSHSLFIGQVVALHADSAILNTREEVDFELSRGGLPYRAATVRERPIDNFRPKRLLQAVRRWREEKQFD